MGRCENSGLVQAGRRPGDSDAKPSEGLGFLGFRVYRGYYHYLGFVGGGGG